jgi:hypothetical protein
MYSHDSPSALLYHSTQSLTVSGSHWRRGWRLECASPKSAAEESAKKVFMVNNGTSREFQGQLNVTIDLWDRALNMDVHEIANFETL